MQQGCKKKKNKIEREGIKIDGNEGGPCCNIRITQQNMHGNFKFT